ncbi:MAG: ligase-associated DNA damage response exonuclease [Bacteroidota bacterium]
MSLLTFTNRGIYCPPADVYIDPWRPVEKALITHGHSDHSRFGHRHYLCTEAAAPVIRHRLGPTINLHTIPFGKKTYINGVQFSFHPAGHIVGSAQIRVEHKGEVWVASGDYKVEKDGICLPFEPIKCHAFITESTFGLPVYKWKPQAEVAQSINDWWRKNQAEGKTSVLGGYSLGKAQRLLQMLDPSIGKIYTHGAVENINEILRNQGVQLHDTIRVTQSLKRKEAVGEMVICPPGSLGTSWTKKFPSVSTGIGSGWMMLRGTRRRRSVDRGFVLSDHADWEGLNMTIKATEAEKVFVTHGYTSIFSKWLNDQGIYSEEVKTEYEGEKLEVDEEKKAA